MFETGVAVACNVRLCFGLKTREWIRHCGVSDFIGERKIQNREHCKERILAVQCKQQGKKLVNKCKAEKKHVWGKVKLEWKVCMCVCVCVCVCLLWKKEEKMCVFIMEKGRKNAKIEKK